MAIRRIEINGRRATAEQVSFPALANYGHFTAMQVRSGRVRGLELHLARLEGATHELFGVGLDRDLVRDHIRRALGAGGDATVRVNVFQPDGDDTVSIMVSVLPPTGIPDRAYSLRSAHYQRPVPHLKHVGGFGQHYYRRLAQQDGYDEALLVGPGGVIAEGAITNIGFFDETTILWPETPCLPGITMRLLEQAMAAEGARTRSGEVRLSHVPGLHGAFVTNSTGVAPVERIDDLPLPVDVDLMKTVTDAYERVPWEKI